MNVSKAYQLERLEDAKQDCLQGLNVLTDMANPDTCKIANLACAIKDLQETEKMLAEMPEMPWPEAEAAMAAKK